MKKSAVFAALSIGVMSISMAFANPVAVNQVRNNATEVMKILNEANGKNNVQVLRKAEAYAEPYFDFDAMTAMAVGPDWKKATPDQKKQLVRLFKDRLIRQYAQAMMMYKGAKVDVSDRAIPKGKNIIEVQAKITPVRGQAIDAQFNMRQSGGQYRIYNAYFAGVSPIMGHSSTFKSIVKRQGIDGLINHLKK